VFRFVFPDSQNIEQKKAFEFSKAFLIKVGNPARRACQAFRMGTGFLFSLVLSKYHQQWRAARQA
jgi:hypothetical protein